MAPLLFILIVVASVFALEGAWQMYASRHGDPDRVLKRLKELANRRALPQAERSGDSALRKSERGSRLIGLIPDRAVLDITLYRAGMPMTAGRFAAVSVLVAIIGFIVAMMASGSTLLGLLGLIAGYLPWLLLSRKASRRMDRFAEQLPDSLELLTRALRAGHGITTGFALVGEELPDPVGTEFSLLAEETRFGIELRDALQNMIERVGNPDLPYFVTAVIIQRQTGGNLAEILGNLGGLLRERAQFHGKVKALTAQGRGAALVLALWLPFITVVVSQVAPDYIKPLLENTWGHAVLATAAFLDVSGYLIARRIVNVEP